MGKGMASNSDTGLRWSRRVMIRYSLLQLPELAALVLGLLLIRKWVDIPSGLFWVILGVWILKDVVLYPFVWRAYDDRAGRTADSLVGKKGIAEERLAPSGYVRVRGELWRAETKGAGYVIERGGSVRVVNREGLTLLVEPWRSGEGA